MGALSDDVVLGVSTVIEGAGGAVLEQGVLPHPPHGAGTDSPLG